MHWSWLWIPKIMSDPIDKTRYNWLTKFDTDYRHGPESELVWRDQGKKKKKVFKILPFTSLGILWLPWPLSEKERVSLWLQYQGDLVASRLHGWHGSYHRRCWLQGKSAWFLYAITDMYVRIHCSPRQGQLTKYGCRWELPLLQRSRYSENFKSFTMSHAPGIRTNVVNRWVPIYFILVRWCVFGHRLLECHSFVCSVSSKYMCAFITLP